MTDEARPGADAGTDGNSSATLDGRLADLVVRPLARTPVTPNMLTLLGLLIGLLAGGLFAQGEPGATYWAGFLFMVAVFMDHVDGAHARATGQTSRFGHFFDHFAALTSYGAMFVGVGIGLEGGGLGDWAPVLGATAGLAVVAIFAVRIWVEERHGTVAVMQTRRGGFEIEDTLYIVGPLAWLGGLEPFILAAGLGAPMFLIWVVWDAVRLSRSGDGERAAR